MAIVEITPGSVPPRTLSENQLERYTRFLNLPPKIPDGFSPHTLLVLATTHYTNAASFDARIAATLMHAQQFPNAKIIFSGKRPHTDRATPEELETTYNEAVFMADRAHERGLPVNDDRIAFERDATNTRENIFNSLPLINPSRTQQVLIVCGNLQARRVQLYIRKFQREHPEYENMQFVIWDTEVVSGNQEDGTFNPDTNDVQHEQERLGDYRRRKHL